MVNIAYAPMLIDSRGAIPDEEEHTLFGAIRSGRASPQSLVDDWIEQYKRDQAPAMLELVQFFISCSGCKGKVSLEMYNSLSHTDIIKRMTEEFDEDSGEYPLVQSSQMWRRFRTNFMEFIQVLIRQCQYSIIYDQCMVEQISSLLTGLSDSSVSLIFYSLSDVIVSDYYIIYVFLPMSTFLLGKLFASHFYKLLFSSSCMLEHMIIYLN